MRESENITDMVNDSSDVAIQKDNILAEISFLQKEKDY
jgi:hypothetical protein